MVKNVFAKMQDQVLLIVFFYSGVARGNRGHQAHQPEPFICFYGWLIHPLVPQQQE
jgi:hypothetical protein